MTEEIVDFRREVKRLFLEQWSVKMLVHFRCKRGARTEHGLWSHLEVSQLETHIFM